MAGSCPRSPLCFFFFFSVHPPHPPSVFSCNASASLIQSLSSAVVILWHRGCVPKYSNLNLNFKFKFEPLIIAEGSRAFGHTLLSGVIVVRWVIWIKWWSNGFILHHHMSNIHLLFSMIGRTLQQKLFSSWKACFFAWKSQAQNSNLTWG